MNWMLPEKQTLKHLSLKTYSTRESKITSLTHTYQAGAASPRMDGRRPALQTWQWKHRDRTCPKVSNEDVMA